MKNGINSMKYFTVLSNLFEGLASVIWLVSSRRNGKAGAGAERQPQSDLHAQLS